MKITQQLLGAVPVVRVFGDVDRVHAPALEKAFRVHLRAGNHRILLDLSSCSYIDSAGLAAIMTTVSELRDDGLLAIVVPNASIRRLLDIVGLYEHRRCAIFKDEPEAVAVLTATPSSAALW